MSKEKPINDGNGRPTILLIDDENEFRKELAQQLAFRAKAMLGGGVVDLGLFSVTGSGLIS